MQYYVQTKGLTENSAPPSAPNQGDAVSSLVHSRLSSQSNDQAALEFISTHSGVPVEHSAVARHSPCQPAEAALREGGAVADVQMSQGA